jgi:hypothetical protein
MQPIGMLEYWKAGILGHKKRSGQFLNLIDPIPIKTHDSTIPPFRYHESGELLIRRNFAIKSKKIISKDLIGLC